MSHITLTYLNDKMAKTEEQKYSSFSKHKEDKILKSVKNGDYELAFKKMYDYYPKIKKMLIAYGAEEEDAKDIFQEAIIILSNKLENPSFVLKARVTTYLYSVCRYLCKDTMAKKNKMIAMDDHNPIGNDITEDYREKESQFSHLDKILEDLGNKCKQLLVAYYYKKKSMKEIADVFNYATVNSAKNQKYKCLERAKKMAAGIELNTAEL